MEYSTEKEILQPILDHGMEGMSEVLQKLSQISHKKIGSLMICTTNMHKK